MLQYIIIALVLIFLSLVGVGLRKSFSQNTQDKPATSKGLSSTSRSEIEEMLTRVEDREAPEEKMGAMCYSIAVGAQYQTYVCPVDGEKTNYPRNNFTAYIAVKDIVKMRRLVESINSTTSLAVLSLDEKRLCHKCSPGLRDDERFVSLVVKYPDKNEHIYENVSDEDMRILIGFFQNKLTYQNFNDAERPLKPELDRIKKMLGKEVLSSDKK